MSPRRSSIDTGNFEPPCVRIVFTATHGHGHGYDHGKTSAEARACACAFKHSQFSNGDLSELCTASLFELLPISNSGCYDLFRDIIHKFVENYRYTIDDVSAIRDRNGHTFLWHAADMGDDAAIKILVQFGFVRLISNTEPKSAHVLAQKRGYERIAERLTPLVGWNLGPSEAEFESERREKKRVLEVGSAHTDRV